MIGVNRRRVMGGGAADEIIMTSASNPEVMAICYAQGWASHADYMTKREAEAVTSFDTAFQGFTGESLMELVYFTSVASVGSLSFSNCSNLKYVWLSVRLVNETNGSAVSSVFNGCSSLIAVRYDDLTRLGSSAYGSGMKYAVITSKAVPTKNGNFIGSKFYVLDGLVDSYKSDATWSAKTILSIHQLPTDYPDCPWLDDLRQKGLIPTT